MEGFLWNMKLNIFEKYVENIQVLLNSDKKNKYLTWRGVNIYDNISLSS
jgi:hypothetical protein